MSTAHGYSEMFEWEDGNPNNEDRAGYAVGLFGDKIRIAINAGEVIGVVGGDNTSTAAIAGGAGDEWHKQHLRDSFNRLKWEPQVMVEWVVNGYRHWYETDRVPADITVPDDAKYVTELNGYKLQREILSEEYKNPPTQQPRYTARWERKEWAIVVILGRVCVRDDTICKASWKRLKSMGSNVSEWLVV